MFKIKHLIFLMIMISISNNQFVESTEIAFIKMSQQEIANLVENVQPNAANDLVGIGIIPFTGFVTGFNRGETIFHNAMIFNSEVLSFDDLNGFFTGSALGKYTIYYGGAGTVGEIGC